jgi:hypothetical protein
MKTAVQAYNYEVNAQQIDFSEIFTFLQDRRDFLLRLLENPVLLEHQTFTSLLQATFHLAEEMNSRPQLTCLPDSDCLHLAGDISRIYRLLTHEWITYLEYLNRNYPYLFSLASRTNPFNPSVSVIINK